MNPTPIQKSHPAPLLNPQWTEPWFYGFLDGRGMFYMVFAGITFFVAAAALILAFLAGGGTARLLGIALGIALLATLPLTFAATIFLFVDAAHNIRVMSLMQQRESGS